MSFDKIIGQEKAKKRLSFFLAGQSKTLYSPNILFVAPRGCGKTLIAQTYASQLLDSEGRKRKLITINCSSLSKMSLKKFVNDFLIPHVVDKEITVLFDEASEIPRDITMAFLTILNPNREKKNYFSYGDYNMEFDFKKISFLFCTTEAHKIFHALQDRLERIDLEEYTVSNLSTIVQSNSSAKISDSAMEEIGKVLRGNARKAIQMADHIGTYLAASGKPSFDVKDWRDFCSKMGYHPFGLSSLELNVLLHLSDKTETTLTNLSAKTQMSRQSLQRDVENYLQKLDLMEVTEAGRRLTAKGREYIAELSK